MLKLILAAVTTIGGFAFWLWRRYGSRRAQIEKLEKKRAKVIKQMDYAAAGTPAWHRLYIERKRLSKAISRLRR